MSPLIRIPLFYTALKIVYAAIALVILVIFFPEIINDEGFSSNTAKATKESILTIYFPVMLVISASVEELVFRAIPLMMVIVTLGNLSFREKVFSNPKLLRFIFYCVAVPVSIFFGWIHGNAWNILIQGVSGLFLSAIVIEIMLYWINKHRPSIEDDYYSADAVLVPSVQGLEYGIKASIVSHVAFNLLITCHALLFSP